MHLKVAFCDEREREALKKFDASLVFFHPRKKFILTMVTEYAKM